MGARYTTMGTKWIEGSCRAATSCDARAVAKGTYSPLPMCADHAEHDRRWAVAVVESLRSRPKLEPTEKAELQRLQEGLRAARKTEVALFEEELT